MSDGALWSDDPAEQVVGRETTEPCLRCQGNLVERGTWGFRTGGLGAASYALLGGLASAAEVRVDLRMLACPRCGSVEFRLPPEG